MLAARMPDRCVAFPRAHTRSAALASALAVIGVATTLTATVARADPIDVINAMRAQGCSRGSSPAAPVRHDGSLDNAARELTRDDRLEVALGRAGYDAERSTFFHVRGSSADEAIAQVLGERYCGAVNDPLYEDSGVFRRGNETWIVLAVRKVPLTLEAATVEMRVLALVNAARAQARRCGREQMEPTGPVTLSPFLTAAAIAHSRDMAQRGSLGHPGSDGSTSAQRVTRAGYAWRTAGENIAAGLRDAEAVVAAWLDSPPHCATLMGPQFTEMGVAFALAPGKNPPIYWTQVFAAPR
jgi:uncharacterized protein YkwD